MRIEIGPAWQWRALTIGLVAMLVSFFVTRCCQ
jgi:hypothetical protein